MTCCRNYSGERRTWTGPTRRGGAPPTLVGSTYVSWSSLLSCCSSVGEKCVTTRWPVFRGGCKEIRKWLWDLREPAEGLGQTIASWLEEKVTPAVKSLAAWFKTD